MCSRMDIRVGLGAGAAERWTGRIDRASLRFLLVSELFTDNFPFRVMVRGVMKEIIWQF